jgi:hypothetical protein
VEDDARTDLDFPDARVAIRRELLGQIVEKLAVGSNIHEPLEEHERSHRVDFYLLVIDVQRLTFAAAR